MLKYIFIIPIKFYRKCISPFKPACCRYTPSCSQYALDAFRCHGIFRAFFLTTKRVCSCHPWGGSGYDPVPHSAKCPHHEDHTETVE